MSEPIIIEIPSPTCRARFVLVHVGQCSGTTCGIPRDATPADLLRAGYVPREVPSAEAWKAAHAEAERELIRARAALAEQPDPGTLAHLRADLRDAVKRAEKAERELRDMSERAGDAERERDEAKELTRVLEVERDAALDARNACAAERNEARAEVERLTAPGEGSLDNGGLVAAITRGGSYRAEDFDVLDLQAAYRLGVAHERARDAAFVRQHGHRDRATDEELLALFNSTVEANSKTMAFPVRSAVAAVAARVRKERCLVAQAVGMPGVRSVSFWREGVSNLGLTWGTSVNDRQAIMQAPADVPAALARLLGEVSRG